MRRPASAVVQRVARGQAAQAAPKVATVPPFRGRSGATCPAGQRPDCAGVCVSDTGACTLAVAAPLRAVQHATVHDAASLLALADVARVEGTLLVTAGAPDRIVLPALQHVGTLRITAAIDVALPALVTSNEVVIDAQPFSFSAIIREGALENDAKGLKSLFSLGGSQRLSWLNDRPIGSFPQNASELDITKPDIIRQLKAIQEFLRQHGEAMVEAKLLSP